MGYWILVDVAVWTGKKETEVGIIRHYLTIHAACYLLAKIETNDDMILARDRRNTFGTLNIRSARP